MRNKIIVIGTILEKERLTQLGFPEDTSIQFLLEHWKLVQQTYNASYNRSRRLTDKPLTHKPFKSLAGK